MCLQVLYPRTRATHARGAVTRHTSTTTSTWNQCRVHLSTDSLCHRGQSTVHSYINSARHRAPSEAISAHHASVFARPQALRKLCGVRVAQVPRFPDTRGADSIESARLSPVAVRLWCPPSSTGTEPDPVGPDEHTSERGEDTRQTTHAACARAAEICKCMHGYPSSPTHTLGSHASREVMRHDDCVCL